MRIFKNTWFARHAGKEGITDSERVTAEIARLGKAARIRAYLNVILKANKDSLMEDVEMSRTTLTLDEVFEKTGLAARWEERKAIEIAKNMLRKNFTIEQTAELSGLDISKVRELSNTL